MPNRVLRDWTCSEIINELSPGAEIFFTRLIMKADDFGCYHGNTKILNSQLFPLKEIKIKDIEKWISELLEHGIVVYYEVDSKKYLKINDFRQRLRIMKSRFPQPEDASPSNDGQTSDDCRRETETETEVETEVETEEETKPKKRKKDIPSLEEFTSYCKEIIPNRYKSLEFSILAKFETWIDDGWKDGHGTPIKNWKTKIKNTIPHLKPFIYGQSTEHNERNQRDIEAQYERLASKLLGQIERDGSE